MIINPIIPIWLMSVICAIVILFIIYNKQLIEIIANKQNKEKTIRQKRLLKQYVINALIKIAIIFFLFIINLRFMLPNGETTAINTDINILFVIDTTVSMKALDYNGNKERFEGVINDCCYIVDELSNCKFSIITFGNEAHRVIPFTNDTDMVQAELKSIKVENDFYAKGSSMNIVKDLLEKTLKDEQKRKNGTEKNIVFFITDGEITREGETLKSFTDISQYIYNGAVLGYGTTTGGKMISSSYANDPTSEFYYIYFYNEDYMMTTAVSKLDENNLKQIAKDLGIDYIQMSKKSNVDYKISNIKQQIEMSKTTEEKINTYQDIYYYFAIPLLFLLIADMIIKKRRMNQ